MPRRRPTPKRRPRASSRVGPLAHPRTRALVVAGVAVAALIAAIVASRSGESDFDPSSLYFIAPPIDVGDAPQSLSIGEGGIWVTNAGDGTVSLIDPASAEVEGKPISVGPIPSGIAAGAGSVWVGFGEASTTISRIDPTSRRVVDENIEVGRAPSSVAVGENAVWAAALVDDVVARIEPTTGEVEERIGDAALDFPSTVTTGLGSVWVTDVNENELVRIAPDTLEVAERIEVGFSPTALAVGEGAIWVVNFDKTVTHVDAADTDRTKSIRLAEQAAGITTGDGFAWATLPRADSVVRIDPGTRRPIGATIPVGDNPQGIVFGDGSLWVANQGDDTVTRIDLHPDASPGG